MLLFLEAIRGIIDPGSMHVFFLCRFSNSAYPMGKGKKSFEFLTCLREAKVSLVYCRARENKLKRISKLCLRYYGSSTAVKTERGN